MKRFALPALAGLLLVVAIAGVPAGFSAQANATQPSAAVEDVSISTEYAFEFLPPEVTVTAGDTIDLVLTQADDIPHTFTLSSVVNYTIPNSYSTSQLYAFFNAHPPLVNLSLPPTVGAEAFANFTAPPIGTYEFVCEIPGHFQEGMYGVLTSTNQANPSGSSSGTAFPLSPLEIGVIGGLVVLIIVGLVVSWRRSRRRAADRSPPSREPQPPPSP